MPLLGGYTTLQIITGTKYHNMKQYTISFTMPSTDENILKFAIAKGYQETIQDGFDENNHPIFIKNSQTKEEFVSEFFRKQVLDQVVSIPIMEMQAETQKKIEEVRALYDANLSASMT